MFVLQEPAALAGAPSAQPFKASKNRSKGKKWLLMERGVEGRSSWGRRGFYLDRPVMKFTQSQLQGLKEATRTADLLKSVNSKSGFDRSDPWIRSNGG